MAFKGDGPEVTNLNADNLTSGTVATARLGSGTASSSTFLRGDNTWAVPGGGGFTTDIFTSTGTWVCPAGVTKIKLTCIGGGGGGGGAGSDFNGGSGGDGGFDYGIVSVTPGTTYTATVGAAGTGSNSASGSAGGETWFGVNSSTKIGRATGGAGGSANGPAGADGSGLLGNLRRTNAGVAHNGWLGLSTSRGGATSATAGLVWTIESGTSPGVSGSGEFGITGSDASGGVSGVVVIEYVR